MHECELFRDESPCRVDLFRVFSGFRVRSVPGLTGFVPVRSGSTFGSNSRSFRVPVPVPLWLSHSCSLCPIERGVRCSPCPCSLGFPLGSVCGFRVGPGSYRVVPGPPFGQLQFVPGRSCRVLSHVMGVPGFLFRVCVCTCPGPGFRVSNIRSVPGLLILDIMRSGQAPLEPPLPCHRLYGLS